MVDADRRARLVGCTVALIAVSALAGCASTPAAPKEAAGFQTPIAATTAFADAMRSQDPARIKAVLGPDADQIITSGDPVQDKDRETHFLQMYDEHHDVIPSADGTGMTLLVGKDNWPFPIPLVQKANAWTFDTARGKDEILDRRIGHNERSTIQVCLAIVDAQQDFVRRSVQAGGPSVYAEKFISSPGKHDGLYWPASSTEPESPLGLLVANAADQGYEPGKHEPYHGYYYRMLFAQGPHATGGAYNYKANGELLGGFAIVAYPAEYGASGVMSFMVSYNGVVFQKDLGTASTKIASAMATFDPDASWAAVK